MALVNFDGLAASTTAAILKHPEYRKGNPDWTIRGMSMKVPSEVTGMIWNYVSDVSKLQAVKKRDPKLLIDLLEIRNILRIFGVQTSPIFTIKNNSLSGMYAPGIYKSTPAIKQQLGEQYDFCLKFGDSAIPVYFDKDSECWETKPNDKGDKVIFRFGYEKVASQEGEITIIVANAAINNSNKSSDVFCCRIGTARDEKNKKKDKYSASTVMEAFNENDIAKLNDMLIFPPSGNGYVYTFAEDKFAFGKYPLVSLKKEKRTQGTKAWFNYVVIVRDQSGSEVSVRLDSKDQPVWQTLTSFYDWEDENGVLHSVEKSEGDELDFASFVSGNSEQTKYAIVYYGKDKGVRTVSGQQVEYNITHITFWEYDADVYSPLSTEEQTSLTGRKVSAPVKKTETAMITGVDDLMVGEEELPPL